MGTADVIPLSESSWDLAERRAIERVVASDRLTMGAEVAAFEREFADWVGSRYAVMVNSGGSANLLMVAALKYSGRLPAGSTVIVPAVSWSTTYAPLIQLGYKLRVVDVDDTLCIDPYRAHGGDAIFAVNLLGNPCDFDAMAPIPTIVDNCESLGCRYKGREGGTLGIMGSYSFFYSHHICTIEGGMIVTDDEELWRMLRMLRAHGWERDLPGYDHSDFESRFRFEVPGFNVRPTEISGALGREQLRKLKSLLLARRRNGEVYKRLHGYQREQSGGESSWYGFAFFSPHRAKLLARIPHETRPIVAGNILRHPMMRWADYEAGKCPEADRVHDDGFFIGNPARFIGPALEELSTIISTRKAPEEVEA